MSTPASVEVLQDFAAVSRASDGAPVLWIHGYTMDSRIWREIWDRLPNWHHHAIDLPGHGRSPMPQRLDMRELARAIGRFAAKRNIRHCVGLSFGGMVALQVAIECPDLFSSLVLSAPALGGGPQDRHAQARNIELSRMYQAQGRGPWLRDLWMTSPPDIFLGASKSPALWQSLREIVGQHQWSELATAQMSALTACRQSADEMRRVTASTLVLIGDEDSDAFKRSAEMIRRAIPDCRRVYLEQTGHLALLERAETIHALIDSHFKAAAASRH